MLTRHLVKAPDRFVEKGPFGVGLFQKALLGEDADQGGDGGIGQVAAGSSKVVANFLGRCLTGVPKDVH